ncbi:glycosyltransferase [Pelosinus sp. sgz500959]|uniref:O-linked N-acetylglucosamine transferase family protein n=1 Tax=Pelosinus sp. sgz500959 TaxID=3242472 RepID=UPI00367264A9
MRNLRIVHVNLFDALGGAASTAWTLMNHMSKQGHDVHIFAHRKTTDDPRVIPLAFPQTGWQKKLLIEESKRGLFDVYSAALLQVLEHPLFEQADLLHLHCINGGYFSFLLLPFLTAKPTIWTLHDPLAFTAGCYNTDDCSGWQHEWCAHCPLDRKGAPIKPQRELMQLLKASIYKMADFMAVCPSQWLQKQVKSSILKNHDIRLIPYGIDLKLYSPGNKQAIRTKLGLPADQQIIMFAAQGGFNDPRKGGKFLIEALQKLHDKYPELLLLNIGTVDQSVARHLPVQRIDLPFINEKERLAEYYQATDLFITPAVSENLGLTAIEACACGTPVVAFDVGGTPEIIKHKETGYLATKGDSGDLAQGIAYFLDDAAMRQSTGEAARRRAVEKFSDQRMVDDYTYLYEELKRTKGWVIGTDILSIRPKNIAEFVENAKISGGWDHVWHEFWQVYKTYSPQEAVARNIFVDECYSCCLTMIDVENNKDVLWKVIEDWPIYRYMPARSGDLPAEEAKALFEFSCILRRKIHEYLVQTPFSQMTVLESKGEASIINVWWHVFLNYFSMLNLEGNRQGLQQEYDKEFFANDYEKNKYINLLLASMYYPFNAEKFDIDLITLWNESNIPNCYKVILSFWLTNIPYYSIEQSQRGRLLKTVADLCQITVPSLFVDSMVNHVSHSFWIASYAGGNNVASLSAFGDFIAVHMSRIYPQYSSCTPRLGKEGDKVRIGYISGCFYHQSVSYYMVNRVIHHDREKFEVYVFALGEHYDDMTTVFSENAKYFQRFPKVDNLQAIAQSIVDAKLDILIYAEIGMDPAIYMLAGMQLAPIQCAMVGHGTTTGLPTIQYYISGDFEPFNAHFHYREKLIRLPNLGAAQYPPPLGSCMTSTRSDWKIPEDAILFVSCANGIKHVPERDRILVEILKRVPNACIAIKPYNSYDTGHQMDTRIIAAAKEAGVEKRLFIVPPLKHVGPLLSIADIQLDTYPYGGWTTNMEALYMGLPIVTQEGDMARSRWGAHMLRALGVYEGIANNAEEYIEWAVRFARDRKLRHYVRERIMRQSKPILFNGASAQAEYEDVLLQIFAKNKQS